MFLKLLEKNNKSKRDIFSNHIDYKKKKKKKDTKTKNKRIKRTLPENKTKKYPPPKHVLTINWLLLTVCQPVSGYFMPANIHSTLYIYIFV